MENAIKEMMLLNKDGFDTVLKRYNVLRAISYIQPVGRRQLTLFTGLSEREIRNETDILRLNGLLQSDCSGMIVTHRGHQLLDNLLPAITILANTRPLANALKERYGLQEATVVAGNADTHILVKRDIGQSAAMHLRQYFKMYSTFTLTGHSTVGYLVDAPFPDNAGKGVSLFPARTAQMNREDNDANSNCARLGKKTGAAYSLLHLGNITSINEIEKRYSEPDVKRITSAISTADMLISGITPLSKSQFFNSMSVRARGILMQSEPCCELLGSFIKQDGRQVNNPPLYSLNVDEISHYKTFMLLGAGKEESAGLRALLMRFKNVHFITDEATAAYLINYDDSAKPQIPFD